MIKRVFFSFVFVALSVVSFGQELKVASFQCLERDLIARTQERLDLNEEPCAVLRISLPNPKDFSFSGNVIGDVLYYPGEAIVYMSAGSRNITIKSDKYGVLKYAFPEKLKKQVAYRLFVKIPSIGIGGRDIAFGVNAGYLFPMISASSDGAFTGSVANYALGNKKENASYSSSGGFSVGAHADFRIYRSIHLIAGVNFIHYKYSNEFNEDAPIVWGVSSAPYALKGDAQHSYKEKYFMSALEIPILASYRLPVTHKSHVQFNLGPVITYGLSAN